MIAQNAIFSRKNVAQRKKKITLKIAQKFCEWKPYLHMNGPLESA